VSWASTANGLLRRQAARFLLVGGTAAAGYAVLAGVAAARWPAHSQTLGVALFLAIAPFAFLAQRRLVFRSHGRMGSELARYVVLQAGSIACASLVVPRLATTDPVWNVGVFAANAAAGAVVSFALCRFVVFGRGVTTHKVQLAPEHRA
jgi:putative flippase GtrA